MADRSPPLKCRAAWRCRAIRGIGYVWALPCTLVGLLGGVLCLLAGGQWAIHHGVLEFALQPAGGQQGTTPRQGGFARLQSHPWPFVAVTLGHAVIGIDAQTLQRLRAHEQQHVRQYERWGLLFFGAYALASAFQWCMGRHAYLDNPFERDARAAAAKAPDGACPYSARCRARGGLRAK